MSPSPEHGLRKGVHFDTAEVSPELVDAARSPLKNFLRDALVYTAYPGSESPADHIRQMLKISSSTGKNLIAEINLKSLVVTPQSNYEQIKAQYEAK